MAFWYLLCTSFLQWPQKPINREYLHKARSKGRGELKHLCLLGSMERRSLKARCHRGHPGILPLQPLLLLFLPSFYPTETHIYKPVFAEVVSGMHPMAELSTILSTCPFPGLHNSFSLYPYIFFIHIFFSSPVPPFQKKGANMILWIQTNRERLCCCSQGWFLVASSNSR